MARTLAQLEKECEKNGLVVTQTGRKAKGPYEEALRNFYWNRDFPGQTMADQLHPMLARNLKDVDEATANEMWSSSRWLAQEKVDGCRLLMSIGVDGSRFTSRRLSDKTYRYNENTAQLPHLNMIGFAEVQGSVLDGEVICSKHEVNTGAVVTKNGLQATVALLAMDPAESARIQREQDAWLIFRVFDILKYKGRDVTGFAYDVRIGMLEQAVRYIKDNYPSAKIEIVPTFAFGKREFYEKIVKAGGEGIMLKDSQATYEASSSRSKAMFKVKRFEEFDAFVTGFVPADEEKGWFQLIGGLECSAYDCSAHPDFTGFPPTHIVGVPINMTLEERIDATSCKNCQRPVVAVTANVAGKRVVQSVKCEACDREMTQDSIMLNPAWLRKVFVIRGQEFTARVIRLKHCVIMSERFDKDPADCVIDVASIIEKFNAKGEETGIKL